MSLSCLKLLILGMCSYLCLEDSAALSLEKLYHRAITQSLWKAKTVYDRLTERSSAV